MSVQKRNFRRRAKRRARAIVSLVQKNLRNVEGRKKVRDFIEELALRTGWPENLVILSLREIPGLEGV